MPHQNLTVAKYKISTELRKLKPINKPSSPPVLAARSILISMSSKNPMYLKHVREYRPTVYSVFK